MNEILTADEAYKLHVDMWTAMQEELGDNPGAIDRFVFKEKYLRERGLAGEVHNNCFLCEYKHQQEDMLCNACLVKWPFRYKGHCCDVYTYGRKTGHYYLVAPISEILALPRREKS